MGEPMEGLEMDWEALGDAFRREMAMSNDIRDWTELGPETRAHYRASARGFLRAALKQARPQIERAVREECARIVEEEDGWEWDWIEIDPHTSYAARSTVHKIASALRAGVGEERGKG